MKSEGMVVASLLALVPSVAAAGGFTIPLVGAQMSGQGAFTAHPADASAVYHNPAGLVLVDAPLRIDLSGTGIITNTAYRRADYPQLGTTGEFDTSVAPSGDCPAEGASSGYDAAGFVQAPCLRPAVTPDSKWGVIPFAGVAVNPGVEGLAFGLGVYSPHNAAASFPADGAQRYAVIDGSITTLYVTPTVAWRPHPAIALGAGLSYVQAKARLTRAFWVPSLFKGEGASEITVDLDATGSTFAWDAGLIFFPGELLPALRGLELGAAYVSLAKLDFSGDLLVTGMSQGMGELFEPSYVEGRPIRRGGTASFTVPDLLRVGVGYWLTEGLWLGADFYYNRYSLYDRLTISLDPPLGGLAEMREDKASFDSYSFAVGGSFTPIPALDVRAGVFGDQSPYPDEYYSILSPDADKLGLTGGVSWRVAGGFELSLSYMALFYADRVITTSKVRPRLDLDQPLSIHSAAPFSGNGQVTDKLVHVIGSQIGWAYATE